MALTEADVAVDVNDTLAESLRQHNLSYEQILWLVAMPLAEEGHYGVFIDTSYADALTLDSMKDAVAWANEVPLVIGAPIMRIQALLWLQNNLIILHWGSAYISEDALFERDFPYINLFAKTVLDE